MGYACKLAPVLFSKDLCEQGLDKVAGGLHIIGAEIAVGKELEIQRDIDALPDKYRHIVFYPGACCPAGGAVELHPVVYIIAVQGAVVLGGVLVVDDKGMKAFYPVMLN